MEYYVISPNVYKNGIERYLQEMADRHIAIMGWSKGDSRQGDMFARMNIGDRVIIAHGANRNKRLYYAGIVASSPKPYLRNGESQYVELYNFKNIRSYKIPFSEDSTYGASNQVPSIYRLKPENDSDIIRAVEQIFSDKTFNIRDVEFWAKYPNRYVSIPALQRGLVWKPKQVELLWDSILRGFPIGSLMLSEIEHKDEPNNDQQYYLIDGQQRFNAIAMGYNAYDTGDPNAIVWIDLCPDETETSTRKYWVKVTTKSHPWGYKNNDECSTLTAQERRLALEKFGLDTTNIYNTEVKLKQTYPIQAKCPVPLFWLLKAPTMDPDVFTKYVISQFRSNKAYKLPYAGLDPQVVGRYYACFKRLKQFSVNTNILTADVWDSETETESNGVADVEILFNRIGVGGTPITANELLYSAIKAYWPNSLKEKNDELAARYMPPVTLIMLTFRLILTNDDDRIFKGSPSTKQVRQIAKSQSDEYHNIIDFYSCEIEPLLQTVEEWLTKDNAPTIIRTSIARNYPDIYLLLMYIARKHLVATEENGSFVQALAYYLYWFGKDNITKCVNTIYGKIKNATPDDFKSRIIESVVSLIQRGLLGVLYSPEYLNEALGTIGKNPDWRPGSNGNSSQPWWSFWCTICKNRDMLMFAQRNYLKANFKLYDPANSDMWDEHNRPWDFDHIIPQDWIHQKGCWRKDYTDYCETWLNTIGNLAAIPFEKNRGKSNHAEWDEYIANKELLFCDSEIESFGSLFNCDIQSDGKQASLFVRKTKDRTIRLYSECYNLLNKLFKNGIFSQVTSDCRLAKRKGFIEAICGMLETAHVYYTYNGDEHELTQEVEWAMPELTIGIPDGDKMVSLYYQFTDSYSKVSYLLGIGKSPHTLKNKDVVLMPFKDYTICANEYEHEWWYLRKEFEGDECDSATVTELVECMAGELKELINYNNKIHGNDKQKED